MRVRLDCGESRGHFRERVVAGLAHVESLGAESLLAVAHKGVIRTLAEHFGAPLEDGHPELGQGVALVRGADGVWHPGQAGRR